MFITDIEWLVTRPIMLNQFRLWDKDGTPIDYASWAFLNDEAEEQIKDKGIRRPMPTDWKLGESFWLIDFVAPFGGQEEMVKDRKEKALGGQPMKSCSLLLAVAQASWSGVVRYALPIEHHPRRMTLQTPSGRGLNYELFLMKLDILLCI